MSLASGIKLAEITPSIVAGLTPRASNVFASAPTGAVRAGLAPYSTKDDVDRLISGLEEYLAKK